MQHYYRNTERKGNGRVYTINFKVSDWLENTAYGSFKVYVPRISVVDKRVRSCLTFTVHLGNVLKDKAILE